MARTCESGPGKLAIRDITPEAVVERLSRRLGRVVGTGRRWSYSEVAHETRIDVRTLKAYVQGTACPNLTKYKRLLAVLGPEIGVDLNAMKGWLPRSDVIPPEALDLEALNLELGRAIKVLAGLMEADDGTSSRPHMARGCGKDWSSRSDDADSEPRFKALLSPDRIDNEAVSSRLGYRLQKMIGEGRRWSIASVAEATEIDRRTLQTYIDGAACPNLARYLRLGHFLGPEIGVELAYMIGWEPRYQRPLPLVRDKVELLLGALEAAEAAVSDFRGSAAGRPAQLRFIRPDCRTDLSTLADVAANKTAKETRQVRAATERA